MSQSWLLSLLLALQIWQMLALICGPGGVGCDSNNHANNNKNKNNSAVGVLSNWWRRLGETGGNEKREDGVNSQPSEQQQQQQQQHHQQQQQRNPIELVPRAASFQQKAMDGKKIRDRKEQTDRIPHSICPLQFYWEVLRVHNAFRAIHGQPWLRLNRDLSVRAQRYADILALNDSFQHENEHSLGENLGQTSAGGDPCNTGMIVGMYNEKAWYDRKWYYKEPPEGFNENLESQGKNIGHYTQMIWHATKEIGVGTAKATTGNFKLVIKYYPPGNVLGNFSKNVFPEVQAVPEPPPPATKPTQATTASTAAPKDDQGKGGKGKGGKAGGKAGGGKGKSEKKAAKSRTGIKNEKAAKDNTSEEVDATKSGE